MKEERAMATINTKCPMCGAKMEYIAEALVLDDGSSTRVCACKNGHEFIERTILVLKG